MRATALRNSFFFFQFIGIIPACRGWGLYFFRKRINYTFVYKVLVESVSAMWLINGIMMSMMQEEAEAGSDSIVSALAGKG